jgi:flagellar basal-body rod modification protein FlgD
MAIPASMYSPAASSHRTSVNKTKGEEPLSKSDKTMLGLSNDFNHFMIMLTTQLKCQDPTAPMDSNQFTQQLVAFTGVEQSVSTNKNLEKLIELSEGSQLDKAAQYIDKEVEVDSSSTSLSIGLDGKPSAKFSYSLPEDAKSLIINVIDKEGRLVHTTRAADIKKAGVHQYEWNGVDMTGKRRDSGTYKLEVKGISIGNEENGGGKEIKGITSSRGVVKGAKNINGVVHLEVNGQDVPISRIISLSSPMNNDSTNAEIQKAINSALNYANKQPQQEELTVDNSVQVKQ